MCRSPGNKLLASRAQRTGPCREAARKQPPRACVVCALKSEDKALCGHVLWTCTTRWATSHGR